MPVSRLLAEGKLDIEVFGSLLAGNPVVDPHPTPKGSLKPRSLDLRRETKKPVCYLRDRDFDFLPAADLTQPTIDASEPGGAILGWRWCRHEIENYLLDPGVIHAALGWDQAAFETELVNAARGIKHYQAARWTVGQTRQILPPAKEFPSKPGECLGHEFLLPADLSQPATAHWVHSQAAAFVASVQGVLAGAQITADLTNHTSRLTDAFLADVRSVLVWCSGKDLFAALMPWLQSTHKIHPSQLRSLVRDWIAVNPDQTLVLLPEWKTFRDLLRA